MSFYIILLTLITSFSYCYSKSKHDDGSIIFKILTFLLMFIPAALRYDVGTDYLSYVSIFNNIKRYGNLSGTVYGNVEIGYILLNKLIIILGLDAQYIIALIALLTLLFFFAAVPKNSFFIIVPFYFMTLYFFSLNGVRQAFTITIAYYAYRLLDEKKLIKSFLCILIATLFHKSAILYFLLFFILLLFNINRNKALILFFIILFTSQYTKTIIDFFLNKIVSMTSYARYVGGWLDIETKTRSGFKLALVLRYFISFIVLLALSNVNNKNASNVLITFLVLVFSVSLSSVVLMFNRLEVAFRFAWFPMLSLVNSRYSKYRKIILLIVFVWECSLFIRSLMIADPNFGKSNITPYKTIFNKH